MSLSEFLKKTFASQKSRTAQAGQAVVEYLLVLIVTVSVIMGALYQFNDAFKNFLDSYFGDYIACLLETGELPSLGGDGPNQGDCNAGFANFNISNGRPSNGSESSGGSGSSGSSDDSTGSGSGSGSDSSSGGRPARFNTSGSTGNGESRGGSGTQDRPGRQSLNNNQRTGDPSGLNSDSTEGGFLSGRGRRVKKKIIVLGDDYLSESAIEAKKRTVSTGKPSKADRERAELKPAKFDLKVPEAKSRFEEEEEAGFSFAFMLKFMLVAGILIALFIFLGGQALSIKKSWQKSE